MTGSPRSRALITLFAVFLSLLCWRVQIVGAQAQKAAAPPPQKEEIPPDSDYMFRKDSAVIDEIKAKETDPQRRADALLAWAKDHPRATRAVAYAASYYGEVVAGVMKAGDLQKALAMIQTFQAAAPANTTLIPMQINAYYQAKNFAKAAELSEKLYAEKPTLEMANNLYAIYGQMNPPNTDKMLVYGEKLVAEVPIEKSYVAALQLAQIYAQRKNSEKALHYYAEVMNIYGDKVPAGYKEADWNAVRAGAFTMMAADSYTKKDYPKATELYEKVTRFAPKGEEACTAWYFIGMAKWQSKDQKGAIEPFAKSYVLGKSLSQKAKEYFEQLYKNEHSGSLDGSDVILAKAKSDLGIG